MLKNVKNCLTRFLLCDRIKTSKTKGAKQNEKLFNVRFIFSLQCKTTKGRPGIERLLQKLYTIIRPHRKGGR